MVAVIPGVRGLPVPLESSVVTLGSFDGVHRGHQTLIKRAVEAAQARGVPSVGYTFHPHPATVLSPAKAPPTIMGIEERAYTMGQYGLDYVLVQPFDADFAGVTADQFVADYLVAPLHPAHVVVGFNFTYGRARAGDAGHLKAVGPNFGFSADVVQAVGFEGEVASSTAVRAYLRDGDLVAAERLLGRRPSLAGKVVSGDQRGRKIGFPTANVAHEGTLVPAHGVYAAWVDILDDHGAKKTTHAAMANIGRRPTFDGEAVSIEAFLIDFEGDLYGRRLRAHLVRRLRSEQKFSGIDALTAQLHRDCAAARAALESS